MANEIRLRANNVQGTITDNPLTNVATTINSVGFVDLPTVTASNHLMLILDPLETAGPAEIVQVTAHTAASTTCTIVRAQESSGARSHSFGTTWFHGPTVADFNFTDRLALSTNRPATPFAGQMIYETDTNRWAAWNGSTWVPAPNNVPACRAIRTTNQSIATATSTAISFDSESFDTAAMHDTSVNTSRVTFTIAGIYQVSGTVMFASNATNSRDVWLQLNGTTRIAEAATTANSTDVWACSLSTLVKVAANEYVELLVFQTSGGNLNALAAPLQPSLTALWAGVG